jgi:hypothetical protein
MPEGWSPPGSPGGAGAAGRLGRTGGGRFAQAFFIGQVLKPSTV